MADIRARTNNEAYSANQVETWLYGSRFMGKLHEKRRRNRATNSLIVPFYHRDELRTLEHRNIWSWRISGSIDCSRAVGSYTIKNRFPSFLLYMYMIYKVWMVFIYFYILLFLSYSYCGVLFIVWLIILIKDHLKNSTNPVNSNINNKKVENLSAMSNYLITDKILFKKKSEILIMKI